MSRIFLLILLCATYSAMAQTPVANPSDCGLHVFIPDLNCAANGTIYEPVDIEISVVDAPGVLGVDYYLSEVRVIIGHTWLNDLNLTLLSPSGVSVTLTANNGGSGDNFGEPTDTFCTSYTIFALEACTVIEEGEAPFLAEPYQPKEHFYTFNDGLTPANGTWRLLVCDDAVVDTGFVEFVHLVLLPIACLPISEIEVLTVDTTSVILEISPAGFCGTTIVEYGLPGFLPGLDSLGNEGNTAIFDCESIILTSLFSDTNYDIYIRRYCETTSTFSPNSCVVNVTTGCQPAPITAIENFDDSPNCIGNCLTNCDLDNIWRNVSNDDMDWLSHSGSTATFGTGPTDDVTGGGQYIYIETSGCTNNMEAILYSSCMILKKQGTDTCHLSFAYHMLGSSIGSLQLDVSADGGFSWEVLWLKQGNQGNNWQKTYIGLGDYDEDSILQFRFIGKKTSNVKGDIALDEIILYGLEVLDYPEITYFLDEDGDNYGQDSHYVLSCTDTPPDNYVLNSGDCDDENEFLNPGMAEIPCDAIDNNCNGVDDDFNLPSPIATGDTICSGEQAMICATPFDGATLLWYDVTREHLLAFATDCFTPDLDENNTSIPMEHTFWVGQILGACFSINYTEISVVVNPTPQGSTTDEPAICPENMFNLASISIEDANFTGASLSFHTNSPANEGNKINPPTVSPVVTTTYYYLLTSPDGCTDEGVIEVKVNPGPDLSFTPADDFSLCRETTTNIEVHPTGGTIPYTYFWNTGATTANIEVSANFVPGTVDVYYVTVTDAAGCFSIDSLSLTSINSIDSISLLVTDVSVCAGGDGSIRIVPLNGLGPYDFYWTSSDGASGNLLGVADTALLTNLNQGVYQVEILDSSNDMCSFNLRSAIVQGPGVVILDPTILALTCYEAADGEICLNIQGANDVQYLWNTLDTTLCIDNLIAGIYAVTITSDGCETILNNLIVTEPDSLFGKCTMTWPTCFDSNDGRIDIQTFGGTSPFQYEWSTTAVSPFIFNQPSGTYFLTITDANNCTTVKEMFLPAPEDLGIVVDSFQNISCFNEQDAFIQVSGIGGTTPYQYAWNTGSTSPMQLGLPTGVYIVSLADFQNCITIQSFVIQNPAILEVGVLATSLPVCVGDFTGSIDVLGQGGTPPYTFFSGEGQLAGSVLNNLGVGEYTFWVKDANNCVSDTLFVTLDSEAVLDFGITLTSPLCVGPATGSITLAPLGLPPFSYIWDTGVAADSNALLSNLRTGVYCVEVYDALGCRYDTCIVLDAPQVFNVDFGIVQPSCFGVDDGIINTSFLASGTAPLTLMWNDDDNMGPNRMDLAPGDYQITIMDVNDCAFVSDTLLLEYPAFLHLEIEDFGNIPCFGDASAYIETNVLGGTPPYNINWIGTGVTTDDIIDLASGEYHLTISDSRLCIIDTVFTIEAPDVLKAFAQILQGDICSPVSIGDTLLALATGGTPPYVFTWNTGSQEEMLTGIDPGDYSFTVEDANGCTAILEDIKLRERVGTLVLDTFFVESISCWGENDARMTAQVSRGSGDYLYVFNPTHTLHTAADSVTCEGLSQGTYSVTVTDVLSGCQVTSEIIEPTPLLPLTITRDSFHLVQCFGNSGGAIYVHASGGTLPYSYQWWNEENMLVSENEDLEIVTAGIYTLIIEDANACLDTLIDESVQDNNTPIEIDTLILTHVQCRDENTGSIDVLIVGGELPYKYEWSYQNTLTEDLVDVPAGVYNLTVTDDQACRVIFPPFVLTQPSSVIDITATLLPPNCADSEDGSIAVVVVGGGAPYDYFWYTEGAAIAGNENILENISVGQYELVLQDTFECIQYDTFHLLVPEILQLAIDLSPPMPPEILTIATAMAAGGQAPYQYLWNTGDTIMDIEIIEANTYVVTITDDNGCQIEGSVLIVSNETVDKTLTYVNVYPNPSSGTFIVDIQLDTRHFIQIEMLDMLGRKVKEVSKTDFVSGDFDIDINAFANGVYFLKLSIDGRFAGLKRVVKY